jgi:hypothetical protein
MNAVIYEFPAKRNWQALYKAAIVEVDSTKQSDRIAEAKRVIAKRARELFQMSGDHFQEEQALDTAVCVLHALHGTLKSRSTAVQPDEQRSKDDLR